MNNFFIEYFDIDASKSFKIFLLTAALGLFLQGFYKIVVKKYRHSDKSIEQQSNKNLLVEEKSELIEEEADSNMAKCPFQMQSENPHGKPLFNETEPTGCPFQSGAGLGAYKDNKHGNAVDIELAEAEARNLKRLQEGNRTPIEQLATLLLRKSNCLQKEVT